MEDPFLLNHPNFSKISRINIVGTSGSGKSTLGRRLAGILGIPYIQMDQVFWRPNWTVPDDETFFADLRKALSGETWVLDGNYNRTAPIKWERIDLVVWLDFSFARTLFQVILRSFRRSRSREELWPGTNNRESFRRMFLSKDSIVWWMIKTHGRMRTRYLEAMADPKWKHLPFVRLRSPREVDAFLNRLQNSRIGTQIDSGPKK